MVPPFDMKGGRGLLTMSAALQMIEEVFMAFLMSIPFNLLVFYLCALQGSFIAFWITWLVSLCDGIGMQFNHPSDDYELSYPLTTPQAIIMFQNQFTTIPLAQSQYLGSHKRIFV